MDYKNKNRLKISVIQFIKFNIIGLSNVFITYGIYSLVVYLSDSHRLALILDYIFGIIYTFIMNKFITFGKSRSGKLHREFIRIIVLYILIFIMNWFLLDYLVNNANWNKYLAQAVALITLAGVSFFGQKYFVFEEKNRIDG